jgi:uncharacterized protein (DUF58 family)
MLSRVRTLLRKTFSRQNSPYIVVSLSGVVFLLFTIIIFFISRYRSHNTNLWVLGVSLVVVGILAMIQTNQNMQSIVVEARPPDPVPEGSLISVPIRLTNHSSSIRYAFFIAFQKQRKHKQKLSSVRANSESERLISLPPQKRGIFPLPPIFIWSFFPFGLCLAWKKIIPNTHAVVYPKPEGVSLKQHPSAGKHLLAENGTAGADDVTSLRRYQQGDSPTALDWRLFAKRGTLFVKAREGGQGAELELHWNHTNSSEDVETRLRQLSKWCHECLRLGLPFRLILPGIPPVSHRNLRQCFESLARFSGELSS